MKMPERHSNDIWNHDAAQRYDTPGEGMFDVDLLASTTSFLAELAAGGRTLEFAIGTGRVAIPLAARGVEVAGIEWSPDMVARLREKVDADTIPVTVGDMASTRVDGEFSLVYVPYNSIANLLTQQAQVNCFRNAAAHLSPGGRFVVELWVPQLQARHGDVASQVFSVRDGYMGVDVADPITQQLVSHHFRFDDGLDARHAISPHRYIWPSELDLMGQLAGFNLEARYADWERSPFTAESTSHISVYRLA